MSGFSELGSKNLSVPVSSGMGVILNFSSTSAAVSCSYWVYSDNVGGGVGF